MSIIRELLVENYKKVRVVEIRPDGRVVTITGRNGQGKTSVLDAIWFALKGTKALPEKKTSVVRKGSERARVKLDIGECVITRTMGKEGTAPTLTLEMAKGKTRDKTPQDFLDDMFGQLTFDPLEFSSMDPKDQIAELKKAASVEVDFDAIAEANVQDFNERRAINREADSLKARLATLTKLEGLPAEKLDEQKILSEISNAGQVIEAKNALGAEASRLGMRRAQNARFIEEQTQKIADLEKQLELAKLALQAAVTEHGEIQRQHQEAEKAFQDAPSGDVAALTQELQNVQRTNRAIDEARQYDEIKKQLDEKTRQAAALTRQMEMREETKRTALGSAKMPVEGLTFDENGVQFKGVPLENMGEGEQLRIAAEIGMAANPKLRVLCIRRGEALDDIGLKMLSELAEQRDFQLWITKVDSSGKVGVVLEDGMVVANG